MAEPGDGGQASTTGGDDGQGGKNPQGQQQQNQSGGNDGGDDEKFSPEYVKQLRAEAAENRKKAADAEKRAKALEDEKLTESERTKKERDEALARAEAAEAKVNQALVTTQFTTAARAAGALYPEQLHRLAEASELALGEDGKIAGIATTMARLRKEYPALFGAGGSGDGRAGTQNRQAGDMNDWIRRQAGRG